MYVNQVTLDDSGTATIVAVTPDPESNWKYRSGAFHSKAWITVNSEYPEWDIKGEFKAPVVYGSWPAFWPTGAKHWPPEIDILEFKGNNYNWFNTFDGDWETKKVRISDAATVWHEYRCHLTQINSKDVKVEFYLDGSWVGTHTGSNFVGEPFDVIVNMQMEGSSGDDGPTEPTYYYARNIVITRNNVAAGYPGPPSAPSNLGATFGDTKVSLDWDASPELDVDYYSVKRSATAGGSYSQIGTTTASAYTDTGLTNDTTYYYVVTATDADNNESGNSNEASATPVTLSTVTVGNYSFELPGTAKQYNWGNVPNWSSDSTASDSGVETGWTPTEGSWTAFMMGSDPSVWQLTGHTIASGEVFTLKVDARQTGDGYDLQIDLYYNDSGSRVQAATNTATLTGAMAEYTLSFTADNVPASIGKNIGIEFNNVVGGSTWLGLDNVRLFYASPEPSSPEPDTMPPTPDPMTWAVEPHIDPVWLPDYTVGTMVATTASDPSSGVEYYFDCIEAAEGEWWHGGEDSGWQSGSTFSDWYLVAGNTYHYRVRARDALGNVTGWSAVAAITVPGGNTAPVASFYYEWTNHLDYSFFDDSFDSDGSIASWSWAFDDEGESNEANPFHRYASAGTYNVTLTVTDNDGGSDSVTQEVTVTAPSNMPPVAPTDLTASVQTIGKGKNKTKEVILNWEDNSNDEDYFVIERCQEAGKGWNKICDFSISNPVEVGKNETFFFDILGSGTFKYRVKACNDNGDSGYSNEVKIR
jgi:PKD repeat protein